MRLPWVLAPTSHILSTIRYQIPQKYSFFVKTIPQKYSFFAFLIPYFYSLSMIFGLFIGVFSKIKTSPLGEVFFLSMFRVEGDCDSARAAMGAGSRVARHFLDIEVFSEFGFEHLTHLLNKKRGIGMANDKCVVLDVVS